MLSGIHRDDSDDELGDADLPWEWIYAVDGADESAASSRIGGKHRLPEIIGARYGDFVCHVGEAVLVKADGSNEAWIAIICEFLLNNHGEMSANLMWFCTEKEIRDRRKRRKDCLWNELYISPSWDVNPLEAINGKATITSPNAFLKAYPTGKIPRTSADFGKWFICRRGCNTRTATFTEEFTWEDIFDGSDESIFSLVELVKSQTKKSRARLDPSIPASTEDAKDSLRMSPKKTPEKSTLNKSRIGWSSIQTTPSTKRTLTKKALEYTPLATRSLWDLPTNSSPFQLACSQLHVAAVPQSLPCREAEFEKVYTPLEAAIADGTGTCIYISGTPGTGKTATVREIISRLETAVTSGSLDDFIFVEINGMKMTDPHQSYSLLWEALRGERISPSQALDSLEHEFGHPSPRRIPCVVLMDELDQLVTRNQGVMYNFFNWPSLPHSRLIVLAVANTMDLPERTLSNKISSRLGLTRITFPGYTHEQLMKIVGSRLDGIPGNIVDADAIQFASRKVAAVSGDARRALDICRRAVELAEKDSKDSNMSSKGRVTISTVKRAINEATTSPTQQYLRQLPLVPKLLLSAMLMALRRNGLTDTTLGDVTVELQRALQTDVNLKSHALEGLPAVARLLHCPDNANRTAAKVGLGSAALELMDSGIILLESHRAESRSKMRLAVGEDEIRMAIHDDPYVQQLGLAA